MSLPDSEMEDLLTLEENELLMEIGRAQSPGPALHSPQTLMTTARQYLTSIRPDLQRVICPRKELVELPEVKLAASIALLLMGSVAASLAQLIAAYVVRRGVQDLCEEWSADA